MGRADERLPLRRIAGAGIAGVALLVGAGACTLAPAGLDTSAPAVVRVAPAATLPELNAGITRAIGDAACRYDSECRVIGLGARSCGGPESFVAWSVARTDESSLQAVVRRQQSARRAEVEKLGLMSTCQVLPEPGVRCALPAQGGSLGRCETLPVRGGAPAQIR